MMLSFMALYEPQENHYLMACDDNSTFCTPVKPCNVTYSMLECFCSFIAVLFQTGSRFFTLATCRHDQDSLLQAHAFLILAVFE